MHFLGLYLEFSCKIQMIPQSEDSEGTLLIGLRAKPPHITTGTCLIQRQFYVLCPRAQQANLPACSPHYPFNAECQAEKL